MNFHSCETWGNLATDKASEQYPIANVCEDCYQLYLEEDGSILHDETKDICYGDKCYYCEALLDD